MGENKKVKKTINKDKEVRKLFSSAALSTAVISWLATAQGLNQYVFSSYWQAVVMSGAIQGALFALSTRGIALFREKGSRKQVKVTMILLWIVLLMSSSIFSYVYISYKAYPDNVLRTDADLVLRDFCLEENYQLLETCNTALSLYSDTIQDYVNELMTAEGGVELSKEDKTSLNACIKGLENADKSDKYSEIATLLDSEIIREYLKRCTEGNFSDNDITSINTLIGEKESAVDKELKSRKSASQNAQSIIESSNERAKQYTNLNHPEFQKISDTIKEVREEKNTHDEIIGLLNEMKKNLNNSKSYINILSSGTENTLRKKANSLAIAMNEEELNTGEMGKIAQEIYEELVNANTTAKDNRIKKYAAFKEGIRGYDQVMKVKKNINHSVKNLQSNSESDNWNEYWRGRLIEIETAVKELPESVRDEQGNSQSVCFKNVDGEEVSKAKIIGEVSKYIRIYLTDINDFVRAWTLLFGIHPYKGILAFSLAFAILIDLFSTGMGVLLYYIPNKKRGVEIS